MPPEFLRPVAVAVGMTLTAQPAYDATAPDHLVLEDRGTATSLRGLLQELFDVSHKVAGDHTHARAAASLIGLGGGRDGGLRPATASGGSQQPVE